LFFTISEKIKICVKYQKILSKLSYATFGMYLFHRVIYVKLIQLFGRFPPGISDNEIIKLVLLIIFGIGFSLIVGYYIQYANDSIIKKIKKVI
jgi:surface polysaccharide O-acyltransferase-like enzyme